MAGNFREILAKTKREIREVGVHEVNEALKDHSGLVLLDVREKDEWEEGHLPGAVLLPRGFLEQKIEKTVTDKQTPIIVYCAGGTRSAFAAKTLQELGYRDVLSMAGGYGEWKNNGLPFVVP